MAWLRDEHQVIGSADALLDDQNERRSRGTPASRNRAVLADNNFFRGSEAVGSALGHYQAVESLAVYDVVGMGANFDTIKQRWLRTDRSLEYIWFVHYLKL